MGLWLTSEILKDILLVLARGKNIREITKKIFLFQEADSIFIDELNKEGLDQGLLSILCIPACKIQ